MGTLQSTPDADEYRCADGAECNRRALHHHSEHDGGKCGKSERDEQRRRNGRGRAETEILFGADEELRVGTVIGRIDES